MTIYPNPLTPLTVSQVVMMYGRLAVVVAVVVMVVVVGGEGVSLRCGVHCTCELTEKYEKDYKVRCNATMLQEVTVSESVFESVLLPGSGAPRLAAANFTVYRTHVLVEGSASLTLSFTAHFFTAWRQFSSCSLDVFGAASVVFPELAPHEHDNPLGHYFAGLGLANVTTREVPAALFSGKQSAGLRLRNSTVGRLPAGLLKGVPSLHYMEVINSTVGVLEGPLGDPALNTAPHIGKKPLPVLLTHSSVGLVNSGALRLRLGRDQTVLLEGVSLGRVEAWAVEVAGAGEVVMKHCTAARVERDALLLGWNTRLALMGNWLAVQPGALTRYPCDDDGQHRISGNHFKVLQHHAAFSPALQHAERHSGQRAAARLAWRLATALHPTCVAANLPAPAPQAPAPWSAISVEQMAAFGAVGAVIGAVVACLTIVLHRQRCRRGRDTDANPPPPVLMSRLLAAQEPEPCDPDPIYEEPRPMPSEPRPLPSPPLGCSPGKAASCGSGRDRGRAAEATPNHYFMAG
ncbi:uncharacterized protein LOC126986416 [Eriocheir sinensis]|uniref:uncharacterized protein LOC126986416 n=1 Tax=Eriocheir sinensis TaxID=95602 RepID=UPI0021C91BC5|nr:uncharacterized protein LOC126986416 [Eriocheir sinensis]